jgi:hypothetical protein
MSSLPNLAKPLSAWLEECLLRAHNAPAAQALWDGLLSDEEKAQLGGNLPQAIANHRNSPVVMWATIRSFPNVYLAAVDLCQRLNLIYDFRAVRLRAALGGSEPTPTPASDLPRWDRVNQKIVFRGNPIRSVKTHKRPSNIERVLDAFETAGWPAQIPCPSDFDTDQLRETLKSLNSGLKRIHFSRQQGSTIIHWESVE